MKKLDEEQLNQISEELSEYLVERALGKINNGDFEGTIGDCTTALLLNTTNSLAYLYRGMAQNRLANYALAVMDLTSALDINLNLADAYIERSEAYEELEDVDSADKDFQAAIKLNPQIRKGLK